MFEMTFSNISVLTVVAHLLFKWLLSLEGGYNSAIRHRHSGLFTKEKIKTGLYNHQKDFKPLLVRYDDESKQRFGNK